MHTLVPRPKKSDKYQVFIAKSSARFYDKLGSDLLKIMSLHLNDSVRYLHVGYFSNGENLCSV